MQLAYFIIQTTAIQTIAELIADKAKEKYRFSSSTISDSDFNDFEKIVKDEMNYVYENYNIPEECRLEVSLIRDNNSISVYCKNTSIASKLSELDLIAAKLVQDKLNSIQL